MIDLSCGIRMWAQLSFVLSRGTSSRGATEDRSDLVGNDAAADCLGLF